MLMERVLVDKPWPDLYDGGREKERGEREGKEKERIRIKLQNVASVEVGSENNWKTNGLPPSGAASGKNSKAH